MAQEGKRGKYARELEKIRQMRALNNMLAKGDVENALLSGGAKESEPASDNVVDSMLDRLQQKEKGSRDVELVEKLTESVKPGAARKRPAARKKAAGHKKVKAHKPKKWLSLMPKRRTSKKAHRRH